MSRDPGASCDRCGVCAPGEVRRARPNACASVGLFADGNDGRYIWKRRLRELRGATICVRDLLEETGIDDIRLTDGASIAADAEARIARGDWARPVRIDGHSVLLVQKGITHESAEYERIDKQRIKEFRP